MRAIDNPDVRISYPYIGITVAFIDTYCCISFSIDGNLVLVVLRRSILMFLRKFLGFILTTSLIGIFLTVFFAITEGSSFLAIGVLFTGAFPFVLLIGVPVSFLSDYLTKNLNGIRRNIVAFLIHSIFGLIAGLVISSLLESLFIVVVTIIAAFVFWLVDEILRMKI